MKILTTLTIQLNSPSTPDNATSQFESHTSSSVMARIHQTRLETLV